MSSRLVTANRLRRSDHQPLGENILSARIANHLDSIHLNVALLSGEARRNEVPEKEICA